MARLYRVILPVTDIEAARGFYESVLGAPGERVSPGRHYFDCEGTILACFDPQADGDGYVAKPNPEPLYLAVRYVERMATSRTKLQAAKVFNGFRANRSLCASDDFVDALLKIIGEKYFARRD